MGDLPLRTPTDRWLGGPLPRRLPNQTHPHPAAVNLYSSLDACKGKHRVLIRLSPGYALLRGRLDTRYSPVRRSPSVKASFDHDAPRLACVKPVASVHPEPGSNSSLYKLFRFPIIACRTRRNGRTGGLVCAQELSVCKRTVELNGSFFTQEPIPHPQGAGGSCFLYYFFSAYVSLSKNSFFMCFARCFPR